MTRALDNVLAKISTLSPDEQDRIAGWLQAELASDDEWTRRFAQSEGVLNSMADEALADTAAGRATEIDPDKL